MDDYSLNDQMDYYDSALEAKRWREHTTPEDSLEYKLELIKEAKEVMKLPLSKRQEHYKKAEQEYDKDHVKNLRSVIRKQHHRVVSQPSKTLGQRVKEALEMESQHKSMWGKIKSSISRLSSGEKKVLTEKDIVPEKQVSALDEMVAYKAREERRQRELDAVQKTQLENVRMVKKALDGLFAYKKGIKQEALKVMKLPTQKRKEYYVKVEQERGRNVSLDIVSEVRKQKQISQGMER